MNRRLLLYFFAANFFVATYADAVHAEMFRCVSADGRVTFTDNAVACPRAKKHEIPDRLQTVITRPPTAEPSPAAPRPSPRLDRQRAAEEARVEKQVWQQKKHAAEEKLHRLESRRSRLARVVTGCNRGAEIIARDATGLPYRVSCDEIREQQADNEEQADQLREYLASGLRRECREAGCLPGWIR